MDIIQEYFDFTEELDFVTKYGLLIANFITIGILIIYKRWKNKNDPKVN
jgi:hypothetical protein